MIHNFPEQAEAWGDCQCGVVVEACHACHRGGEMGPHGIGHAE
jgi:hypothetical protein